MLTLRVHTSVFEKNVWHYCKGKFKYTFCLVFRIRYQVSIWIYHLALGAHCENNPQIIFIWAKRCACKWVSVGPSPHFLPSLLQILAISFVSSVTASSWSPGFYLHLPRSISLWDHRVLTLMCLSSNRAKAAQLCQPVSYFYQYLYTYICNHKT